MGWGPGWPVGGVGWCAVAVGSDEFEWGVGLGVVVDVGFIDGVDGGADVGPEALVSSPDFVFGNVVAAVLDAVSDSSDGEVLGDQDDVEGDDVAEFAGAGDEFDL